MDRVSHSCHSSLSRPAAVGPEVAARDNLDKTIERGDERNDRGEISSRIEGRARRQSVSQSVAYFSRVDFAHESKMEMERGNLRDLAFGAAARGKGRDDRDSRAKEGGE